METSFLTEGNGSPSSMRLIAMMLVIAAIVIGGWIVYSEGQSENAMMVFFSLLGGGIGGKLGQKHMEAKPQSGLIKNKLTAP